MGKFTIELTPNIKNLKEQIRKGLKEKFGMNVDANLSGSGGGSSSGGSGGGKKTNNLLEGILSGVGPLAVLHKVASVMGVIESIFGFVGLGLIKLVQGVTWMSKLIDNLKDSAWWGEQFFKLYTWLKPTLDKIWEKVGIWIDKVKVKLVEWFEKAVAWIKSLPGKIWGFLKALPSKIWDLLKIGFEWIKEKFIELKTVFVEKFIELKDKVVEKLIELKDSFMESVLELKDKFIEKLVEFKDKAVEKFDILKDKIVGMKDKVVEKLTNLWNSFKNLPSTIASAVKSGIKNILKSDDSVDDAVFSGGKVYKTNPNDTIIATQTPGSLGGSGIIVNNFYGVTVQEAVNEVTKQLGTKIRGSGSRF